MAAPIRDFLYLDVDKVRSLLSQALEGVSDSLTKTTTQHGGSDVKLVNYAYERSSSETVSIHHYLYSRLEEFVIKEKAPLDFRMPDQLEEQVWTEDSLGDGKFLIASGALRLLDFHSIGAAMSAFPKLLQTASKLQEQALKKRFADGTLSKQDLDLALQTLRTARPDLKEIQQVTQVIEDLYGEIFRMRLYPFTQCTDRYFAAALSKEYLQRPSWSLLTGGGMSSPSSWTLVGLIDRFETLPLSAPGAPSLANLEDTVLGLISAFSELSKLAAPVSWPVVAINPIAIYRTV